MCSFLCWAICCTIMSPVGIVLLGVIGILCAQESMLIELKTDIKKDRAISSFVACGLYAVMLVVCIVFLVLRSKIHKNVETNNDDLKGRRSIASTIDHTG